MAWLYWPSNSAPRAAASMPCSICGVSGPFGALAALGASIAIGPPPPASGRLPGIGAPAFGSGSV